MRMEGRGPHDRHHHRMTHHPHHHRHIHVGGPVIHVSGPGAIIIFIFIMIAFILTIFI